MDQFTRMAVCSQCGRPLSADAPEGLCAACLLSAGAEWSAGTLASDAQTVLSPFSLGEVAGPRLVPGQVFGAYRIGRMLGHGGMGEVYEAEHIESGRHLALKVLRGRLHDVTDRARFLREGQLAASVSHPHTVYIFGSEEISGMPVIAMELVTGGTLRDCVDARGPMPYAEAVSAVLDILGGLDAAHAAGILHRDIKPANCFRDADGSVKVGDFGLSISTLARDVQSEAGPQGFQGTPQFAAPEQLRGEPLDVRADIYAVGATLYYLLTGSAPFDARNLRDLVAAVTSEPPPSPRAARPEIPAALAAIVQRCLAKHAQDRPESYAALADALRPFSLTAHVPARLGIRTMAGIIDSVLIGLPMNLLGTWHITLESGSSTTARVDVWTAVIAVTYYFVLEAWTGASLGKRLFGLRVVTPVGGAAPIGRIAVRTALFCAPNLAVLALVLAFGRSAITTLAASNPALGMVLAVSTIFVTALLFAPARAGNGYAAIHDRASRTRVVARSPRIVRRRDSRDFDQDPCWVAAADLPSRCGPFEVLGRLGQDPGGITATGFDPVLRRRVWIRLMPTATAEVAAARRDVGRVTRLRWIAGRRSSGENWDAYEAPPGTPLLRRRPGEAHGWPVVKAWLMDIAAELLASGRDGTTPTLDTDRVWIRHDGHAVLLDFPAPGADPTKATALATPSPLSPSLLLGAVATCTLRSLQRVDPNTRASAPVLPQSVASLLRRWSREGAGSLEQAHADLAAVVGVPDTVARWRRAIPIVLAAAPVVLLIGGAMAVLPLFRAAMTAEMFEMYGLLAALEATPPSEETLAPAERLAIERYLAGRHREALTDERFWSSAVARSSLQRLRATAARVADAHPDVPPEELARATTAIAPRLERFRTDYAASAGPQVARAGTFIAVALSAIGLGFACLGSLISALAVPGGILMRLLGLTVVARDGTEIGRGRSFLRGVVAWMPALLWFGWLGPSSSRGLSPSDAPAITSIVVLSLMAVGAVASIVDARRGPVGRMTGTWVVPR